MEHRIEYREILEAIGHGIIVTDETGRIVLINRQSEKILQLEAGKNTERNVTEILPLTGGRIMECIRTGKRVFGSQVIGKKAKLVVNVTPILDGNRIRGAVCNFQELSVFEHSARNLESYKKLARQLETVFQASSDGIWVCDGKGRIISVNEASERLNGIDADAVTGRNVGDLVKEGLLDRSVTLEVLSSGRRESILQNAFNTGRELFVTGTPAFDEHGGISLVVVNERDVTELNRLRGITEKYREELAELTVRNVSRNEIIAESENMRHVLHTALKLSRIRASNILILGDSGTGKGMLARFIHKNSGSGKHPFIAVNCAALPENLLEAELFGYEKGAFTGAGEKGKAGLVEVAGEGTLFLDEIGDMPLSLQAKLLTCLDGREIRRLGGLKGIPVRCSMIAATNRDLDALVHEGKFRRDLYYRLNSFVLQIPPLRTRPEDVFELARFYLEKYNREYNRNKKIGPDAMETLQAHPFPGNVRELISLIKKGVVLSDDDLVDPVILAALGRKEAGLRSFFQDKTLPEQLEELERKTLSQAAARCKTTREIARMLGISQSTVVRKMKKHGIAAGKTPSA